jgi:xylulokinase
MAAGGSFQWYRNVLGESEMRAAKRKKVDPYELLTAMAEKAPVGSEGVFWLPYLTGERTPHADPNARACWIGINSRTTKAELIRSLMEGVTFGMNDVVSVLEGCGAKVRQVRLSGGGARSEFWRQMQADIYGKTCVTINSEEGSSYGVALLAAVGTGHYSSVPQACKEAVSVTRTIKPRAKQRRQYAKLYEQYTRLYPALKDEFQRIAQL